MFTKGKLAATAVLVLGAAIPAGSASGQSQKVTGPVADYWVSAATTSGMLGGMQGMGQGGRRPGMGAMMGMAMGRGGGVNKSLTLQLGSTLASSSPQADHLPPGSLGAGQALPLLTPQRAPVEPSEDPRPPEMRRPEGRMLIYWGCGDRTQPGQPVVIDFAKITQGQMPKFDTIAVKTDRPPSPGRYKTYGEWPNERTRTQVPPTGSLVGAHAVKGNYSPPINFALGPNQDFMAPLNITGQDPTPMGGTRLTWNFIPQSTGYFAWMMGAGEEARRGGATEMVLWTSSNSQAFMGALMDYIPPSEARRLVAAGAVMSPQTTTCTIPADVVKAAPMGMLSMIAYGDEANFVDPPRPGGAKPWDISWRVKVRYKSTTGTMLGMPGMGGMSDGDDRPQRGQRGGQPQQQRPGMGGILGGAIRGGIGF